MTPERFAFQERTEAEALTCWALGFDVDEELTRAIALAAHGGPPAVRAEFDEARSTRLFQALLSTGRYQELDEHWQAVIELGLQRGTLAPPEWN